MKNELGNKIVEIFSLDKIGLRFFNGQKIVDKLDALQSGAGNKNQLYIEYLGKKVKYMFWGVVCVVSLLLVVWLMPKETRQLVGNAIERNSYGEAEKSVILMAASEGVEEEIELLIEPLHYTKAQLGVMAEEVFEYLDKTVFMAVDKGEGEIYVVSNHLKLPLEIEGYPFSIDWESSDYNVFGSDGQIQEGISKEGEMVSVTAQLDCYEYSWEKEYVLEVFPVEKDWKEGFSDELERAIEELDYGTCEKTTFQLPREIDGHEVIYKEKTGNTIGILAALGCVCLIFLWVSMDSNLSKSFEERNSQLLADYAKLVSKLSLYLGAGLSFRTAIFRIVKNADKNRFYAKELEIAVHELENGIAEHNVIDNFARRCHLPCYIKLSVLLNQNMKKGNSTMLSQLKEEADKAFEDRKMLARRYGEEAGTKLLFPMILMLAVVMVMIMYPAFVSFTI